MIRSPIELGALAATGGLVGYGGKALQTFRNHTLSDIRPSWSVNPKKKKQRAQKKARKINRKT